MSERYRNKAAQSALFGIIGGTVGLVSNWTYFYVLFRHILSGDSVNSHEFVSMIYLFFLFVVPIIGGVLMMKWPVIGTLLIAGSAAICIYGGLITFSLLFMVIAIIFGIFAVFEKKKNKTKPIEPGEAVATGHKSAKISATLIVGVVTAILIVFIPIGADYFIAKSYFSASNKLDPIVQRSVLRMNILKDLRDGKIEKVIEEQSRLLDADILYYYGEVQEMNKENILGAEMIMENVAKYRIQFPVEINNETNKKQLEAFLKEYTTKEF